MSRERPHTHASTPPHLIQLIAPQRISMRRLFHLFSRNKSIIWRQKMGFILLLISSFILCFCFKRKGGRSSWPLTKLNPQCLLSALSPTYALSISPSPVAIIHQIRNGVEKTARRIVDPLNTRGGGGMYRRARQLRSHGC